MRCELFDRYWYCSRGVIYFTRAAGWASWPRGTLIFRLSYLIQLPVVRKGEGVIVRPFFFHSTVFLMPSASDRDRTSHFLWTGGCALFFFTWVASSAGKRHEGHMLLQYVLLLKRTKKGHHNNEEKRLLQQKRPSECSGILFSLLLTQCKLASYSIGQVLVIFNNCNEEPVCPTSKRRRFKYSRFSRYSHKRYLQSLAVPVPINTVLIIELHVT